MHAWIHNRNVLICQLVPVPPPPSARRRFQLSTPLQENVHECWHQHWQSCRFRASLRQNQLDLRQLSSEEPSRSSILCCGVTSCYFTAIPSADFRTHWSNAEGETKRKWFSAELLFHFFQHFVRPNTISRPHATNADAVADSLKDKKQKLVVFFFSKSDESPEARGSWRWAFLNYFPHILWENCSRKLLPQAILSIRWRQNHEILLALPNLENEQD